MVLKRSGVGFGVSHFESWEGRSKNETEMVVGYWLFVLLLVTVLVLILVSVLLTTNQKPIVSDEDLPSGL